MPSSRAQSFIGEFWLASGNLQKAFESAEQAMRDAELTGVRRHLGRAQLLAGKTLLARRKWKQAEKVLCQARKVDDELGYWKPARPSPP